MAFGNDALIWHPDRNRCATDEEKIKCGRRLKAVNVVYHHLKDIKRRKEYGDNAKNIPYIHHKHKITDDKAHCILAEFVMSNIKKEYLQFPVPSLHFVELQERHHSYLATAKTLKKSSFATITRA